MQPLSIGMQGDAVAALQQSLAAVGVVSGQPTGAFDVTTQKAVIEAQRRAGLPQTGVVDDATWNVLYQMQSSVTASSDVSLATGAEQPAAAVAGPSRGSMILIALGVGLATYYVRNRFKSGGRLGDDEDEDEEDDYEDDDGEDIDFEPPGRRTSMADLDDAVTDELLEAPARIARSRRPQDCKKASRMLLKLQAVAKGSGERSLYDRTVQNVASDCPEELKKVAQEAITRWTDVEDDVTDILEEEKAVLDTEREERDDGTRGRKFVAPGFRKTKTKWTKKTSSKRKPRRSEVSPGEKDLLDSIAHTQRAGRKGASAIRVKKRGPAVGPRQQFTIRKEKAKTKSGHTWRKVKDD